MAVNREFHEVLNRAIFRSLNGKFRRKRISIVPKYLEDPLSACDTDINGEALYSSVPWLAPTRPFSLKSFLFLLSSVPWPVTKQVTEEMRFSVESVVSILRQGPKFRGVKFPAVRGDRGIFCFLGAL